jgi:hypothetical protein
MRTVLLPLLVLTLAGCTQPFAGESAADLAKMVQDANKLGWVRHDADGFFAIWADHSKRVEGRTSTPDKYDTTLTRKQFGAVTRLCYAVPPPNGVFLTFEDVQSEIKGDTATVQFTMIARPAETYFGPRRTLTTGELFHLKRTDGKWRVEENRSWPIESWADDFIEKFDAGQWAALDDRVEKAQTIGERVAALQRGWRLAEAHALAKVWSHQIGRHELKPNSGVWSEDGEKHPEPWVSRGLLAICVGDADDAKASFKHALEIDPKANMPEYARVAAR